jgi:hypothetical protein
MAPRIGCLSGPVVALAVATVELRPTLNEPFLASVTPKFQARAILENHIFSGFDLILKYHRCNGSE